MRTPEALLPLVEYGIVEEVLRPLMSGKEAQIYLVLSGGEHRVAKVYKDAQQRTFKHRVEYTEGRKTRNSRDQRAIGKHTRHGRAQDEAAWKSAEVDAIYRLQHAGVRVPFPHNYVDGVLLMELVKDAHGDPAPRLGDLSFEPAEAKQIFDHLLAEVVRMLCAGIVHGDLSDFNVLMAADGPVIIDFPQAVDPASNQSARKLLIRDVDNLHRFLGRFSRTTRPLPYAQEMWDLYQSSLLTPETKLVGRHAASQRPTNTADVLALIGEADRDARRRREATGQPTPSRGRKVEVVYKNHPGTPDDRGARDQAPQRPPNSPQRDNPRRAEPPRDPGAPRPANNPRDPGAPRPNNPRDVDAPRTANNPRDAGAPRTANNSPRRDEPRHADNQRDGGSPRTANNQRDAGAPRPNNQRDGGAPRTANNSPRRDEPRHADNQRDGGASRTANNSPRRDEPRPANNPPRRDEARGPRASAPPRDGRPGPSGEPPRRAAQPGGSAARPDAQPRPSAQRDGAGEPNRRRRRRKPGNDAPGRPGPTP